MSLLTITKLNESVGAEVTGLDPAHLAADDPVGAAILDALEDNGVLRLPRAAISNPRPRSPSAAASARSITPRTGITRSPASTR